MYLALCMILWFFAVLSEVPFFLLGDSWRLRRLSCRRILNLSSVEDLFNHMATSFHATSLFSISFALSR